MVATCLLVSGIFRVHSEKVLAFSEQGREMSKWKREGYTKKLYLFDYAQIEDAAARFEAMVALELYRAISTWNERGLGRFQLIYVRNRDKEECNFFLTDKRRPVCLIETKLSEAAVSKSLMKFQDQLRVPAIQLVMREGVRRQIKNGDQQILVVSAWDWLRQLP